MKKAKLSKTKSKVYAHIKYLKSSPIKLRRIANVVRGEKVNTALNVLRHLPHKSSELLFEAIHSAKANAINNHKCDESTLYISSLLINEGPRQKRFQARARGRIFQIQKKTSHIVVGLDDEKGDK